MNVSGDFTDVVNISKPLLSAKRVDASAETNSLRRITLRRNRSSQPANMDGRAKRMKFQKPTSESRNTTASRVASLGPMAAAYSRQRSLSPVSARHISQGPAVLTFSTVGATALSRLMKTTAKKRTLPRMIDVRAMPRHWSLRTRRTRR